MQSETLINSKAVHSCCSNTIHKIKRYLKNSQLIDARSLGPEIQGGFDTGLVKGIYLENCYLWQYAESSRLHMCFHAHFPLIRSLVTEGRIRNMPEDAAPQA